MHCLRVAFARVRATLPLGSSACAKTLGKGITHSLES